MRAARDVPWLARDTGAAAPRTVMALREVLDEHREELAARWSPPTWARPSTTRRRGRPRDRVGRARDRDPPPDEGPEPGGLARGSTWRWCASRSASSPRSPRSTSSMIPLWFLPYAVACGNTFILKPSERDPRPSQRIIELIAEREIFLPASSTSSRRPRRRHRHPDHPGIDAISFVGQASTAGSSPPAAPRRQAGAGPGRRQELPGGDARRRPRQVGARDPAVLVRRRRPALPGGLGPGRRRRRQAPGRGPRSAPRRAEALKVGAGSDPDTDVCPMVGPDSRERAERMVGEAVDGRRPRSSSTAASTAARPGPFFGSHHRRDRRPRVGPGPRGGLRPACSPSSAPGDLDEALEFVNGSRYGNSGSIFTQSGDAAPRVPLRRRGRHAGRQHRRPAPVAWFPFSGWKDSLDGDLHANGNDAVEFYTARR